MLTKIVVQHFFDRFKPGDKNSCWEWTGVKNAQGYGKLGSRYAHRISWEIHNEEITGLLVVCHHCDNPSCVNPLHLFIGTQKDNMQDMIAKGRQPIINVSGVKNPMFCKRHTDSAKLKQSAKKTGAYTGSKHPRATINERTVALIREMRLDGRTAKNIAEKLSVSWHVVRNVIYKKSWK